MDYNDTFDCQIRKPPGDHRLLVFSLPSIQEKRFTGSGRFSRSILPKIKYERRGKELPMRACAKFVDCQNDI